jgi:Zn-dependent metalloprotease
MRTISHRPCFVIPPHMLRSIAGSRHAADSELREGAQETIDTMHALVQEREHPELLASRPKLQRRLHIYDAGHLQKLPGKLVLTDREKRHGDTEALEAYDGCTKTYDFYADAFSRNSIDNRGQRMDSTVHYGKRFDNAFWNGRQMIYGDGDGKLFRRFTAAIDVIGHELTHGVTQHSAALGYYGQTGALNEHLSDVIGMMLKHWVLDLLPRESDFVIGAGLFTAAVHGKGVRCMLEPGTAYDDPILGKDPQPSHMDGYVVTSEDNGGIHINSGIPNRAWALAALELQQESWLTVGPVWYQTLTERLQADAQFDDFAAATVDVAGEIYGLFSNEQRAIANGWEAVGLPVPIVPTPRFTHPTAPAPVPASVTNAVGRNALAAFGLDAMAAFGGAA